MPNKPVKSSATATNPPAAATLGALKRTDYRSRSVKDELRENTIAYLREGKELFPGIVGYERTVVPSLIDALLA
jgi:magnesium chelatase subunit I